MRYNTPDISIVTLIECQPAGGNASSNRRGIVPVAKSRNKVKKHRKIEAKIFREKRDFRESDRENRSNGG